MPVQVPRAAAGPGRCPLCAEERTRVSPLGPVVYREAEYRYRECLSCGSLFCDPMPDGETLAHMYGPAYATSFADDGCVQDPKEPQRALSWLKALGTGTFVDFGCGAGELLAQAG